MSSNVITDKTRQNIIDILTKGYNDEKNNKLIKYYWSGRIQETKFLSGLYDLKKIESTDNRFNNAYEDITQHRIRNQDWEDDWVFYDSRFGIKNLIEDEFLNFILKVFSPDVRDESKKWEEALKKINEFLKVDGYEFYESEVISGRRNFKYRICSEMKIKLEQSIDTNVKLHLIGEGSYAKVFKFKDKFYDKFFIIKRAKKGLDRKEFERFKKEYIIMKELKSPYILEVYKYDDLKGEYYAEYADQTIYDYISKNNNNLNLNDRIRIVYQIFKGFEYIHKRGYLHRDISLNNILLMLYEDSIVVKISDFGLVKEKDSNLTSLESEVKGSLNDSNLSIIGFKNYSIEYETYALTRLILFVMTGKKNIESIDDERIKKFVMKGIDGNIDNRYKSIKEMKDFFYECYKIMFEDL